MMWSAQRLVPYAGVPRSIVAILLAGAFGLGALTGFGLQRVIEDATHGGTAIVIGTDPAFKSVADNDMSGAARVATYGSSAGPGAFRGVADNDMSGAARVATYGSRARPGALKGVADNNMSDAANRARYGADK
jgi:hypothetical protein